jgi:lysophospholipase L1-like esterase
MRPLILLALAAFAFPTTLGAQTPGDAPNPLLNAQAATQLATRAVQLMESTAAAVPGLPAASAALRHTAEQTLAALVATPQSPGFTWQFSNQLRAYISLSEAFSRPHPFPQTAADQFTELRDAQDRLQRHMGALLEANVRTTAARDADPNNLKRFADANSKLLPATKLPRVVFMGDSITDFWRLNEYFTGRDFVNRGISGQTTTQMLGRFKQDVLDLKPKAVLILAGTNDIARGIAAGAIEDNLSMMGDLAKARGIKVLFASILPVSDYHKAEGPRFEMTKNHPPFTIQQVNIWLKEYCRKEGFAYVDYYSAMADANGQIPADQSDDGLHPNAKGYRVMSPVALQSIDRLLAMPPPAESTPAQQKRRFGMLPAAPTK